MVAIDMVRRGLEENVMTNVMENESEVIEFRKKLSKNLLADQFALLDAFSLVEGTEITAEEDSRMAEIDDDEFADDFSGDVFIQRGQLTEEQQEVIDGYATRINELLDNDTVSKVELKNKYIGEDQLEHYTVTVRNPSSKKDVEKIYAIHRDDLVPYVTIDNSDSKRIITMDFGLIFNRPELADKFEVLFKYHIDKKAYQGILDKLVNDLNFFMNEYPELALKIFRCRTRAFREKENYNDVEFLVDVLDIINDNQFRSYVHEMIESTYTISLDEMSRGNKKIIEDLQLTDKSNKILLECAIMDRILIPVINQYCIDTDEFFSKNSEESKYRFNKLSLVTFNYISRFISNERGVNINSKLFKIVEPRVKSTNYTDRVIWRMLESHTLDAETAINKFVHKVIRSIIPKLDTNKSSISFLDVVIRKMITCDFKFKYLYSFKTIKISDTDDDEMNELDKIALTHYHKSNEMTDIIVDASIQQFIKKYAFKYNITEEHIDNLEGNITALNEFQINIMNIYYDKYFPLNHFPLRQTLYLLCIISRIMEEAGLENLSKIILGKINSTHKVRNTGRISADITKSKSYQQIRERYQTVINKFDKGAFLLKLSSVHNFDFIYFDMNDGSQHDLDGIDKKTITSEIFEFVLLSD